MKVNVLAVKQKDGYITNIHSYLCGKEPTASVIIFHGMAEYYGRYEAFAMALNTAGIDAYLFNHRGHGEDTKYEELGHIAGKKGSCILVADALAAVSLVRKQKRTTPYFLFGHSMGSMIARCVLQQDDDFTGAVICGTTYPAKITTRGGLFLSSLVARLKGPEHRSTFLNHVMFESRPYLALSTRTVMDWLTRDNTVVGNYIHDPFCGFLCSASFYHDLIKLAAAAANSKEMLKTKKELPLLIISGDQDPVGAYGKEVRKLSDFYAKHGYTDVTLTLYPECRHELLNELNKEEIMKDTISWLTGHIPKIPK